MAATMTGYATIFGVGGTVLNYGIYTPTAVIEEQDYSTNFNVVPLYNADGDRVGEKISDNSDTVSINFIPYDINSATLIRNFILPAPRALIKLSNWVGKLQWQSNNYYNWKPISGDWLMAGGRIRRTKTDFCVATLNLVRFDSITSVKLSNIIPVPTTV